MSFVNCFFQKKNSNCLFFVNCLFSKMEYKDSCNYEEIIANRLVVPNSEEKCNEECCNSEEEQIQEKISEFNVFHYRINELINEFESITKEFIGQNITRLGEIIFKLLETLKISQPEFIENQVFINMIFESEIVNACLNFLLQGVESIGEPALVNLMHFLAIVSNVSEQISFKIFQNSFFDIFMNPDRVPSYSEELIINGVRIANSIIKVCDMELLKILEEKGFINYLISLIQRSSLDMSKEEFDIVISTTLSNYFDRVFKAGDESIIGLANDYFMTFITIHPHAKKMIINLAYNLLTCVSPTTGKPILSTKDFVNIRLDNGALFINEILLTIGSVSYETSIVATKLAIHFFSKNVLSPKRYYLIALNVPWSLLTTRKITGKDELSERIIELITTILKIDQREVDPKFRPEQTFYDLVSSSKCVSRIIENYDSFSYGNRVSSVKLFHVMMIICNPAECRDIISQGLINFLFEQLDDDNMEIPPLIIDGLLNYIPKVRALGDEYFQEIVDIANEMGADEILLQFEESEFSEKAHLLYNTLGYEDDDGD